MIHKLIEQLKKPRDYPDGYQYEGWLALDDRLEKYDRKRRKRRYLLWWLPFLALFALNGWLWHRIHLVQNQQNTRSEKDVTVVMDTIYERHTIVIADTIYISQPYSPGLYRNGDFKHYALNTITTDQLRPLAGTEQLKVDSTAEIPVYGKIDNKRNEQRVPGQSFHVADVAVLPGKMPARVFSKPLAQKNIEAGADDEITYVKAKPRARNREIYSGIHLSPILAQYPGAMPAFGAGFIWRNELGIGSDQLFFWQSVGWQQLVLRSNEKRNIPGFVLPPPPQPGVEFEGVTYVSNNAVLQAGLIWRFELLKKLIPTVGVGFGGNYRFNALQLTLFEADEEEEYSRVRSRLSTGWAGFSGNIEAGLDWQVHQFWRLRLAAAYSRMLQQKLPDGNIDHGWGLNAGVFYRLR